MQCEVWSVECQDFASSLAEKKAACRGKDTVGTGCLRTIGHLFLGNFRRRLARALVRISWNSSYLGVHQGRLLKVVTHLQRSFFLWKN